MEVKNKIIYFEEVLYHLYEWYKEKNPEGEDNDLSILKVMKLLFFVSGVVKSDNLFEIFDKFQAWQYGHVEADIYNDYFRREGVFENFRIDRNKLEKTNYHYFPNNNDDSKKIKKSIDELKKENPDIISYDAFRLVDISHSYHSWNIYYNKLKKRYEDMEKEMLIYEPKYYK